MKCSKNTMIGLMVVIGVVLMISLMSSPFMSGLEGFQEGAATAQTTAQSTACNQYKTKCKEANRNLVKEMKDKNVFVKNGGLVNAELDKPDNKKYKEVMKDTNCKELLTRGCDF